jgi:hypothetical protein
MVEQGCCKPEVPLSRQGKGGLGEPTCIVVQSTTSMLLQRIFVGRQCATTFIHRPLLKLSSASAAGPHRLDPARKAKGERKQLATEKSLMACRVDRQRSTWLAVT